VASFIYGGGRLIDRDALPRPAPVSVIHDQVAPQLSSAKVGHHPPAPSSEDIGRHHVSFNCLHDLVLKQTMPFGSHTEMTPQS